MELKMENPTQFWTDEPCASARTKIKNLTSWSLRKKKRVHFCNVYFVQRKFFSTFVFYIEV